MVSTAVVGWVMFSARGRPIGEYDIVSRVVTVQWQGIEACSEFGEFSSCRQFSPGGVSH